MNERFSVSNSAASGASYEWDFCAGDLSQLPEVSELSTEGLPGYPGSMKNVAFNGNYYGFCYSYSTNALYRFDYGNDFSSNPTFTNLTSIQSALSGPAGVALVQETSGDWVGLVSNYNSGSLLRLHFGKSLTNAPTASAVSLPVSLSNPSNLTLVRDGTNLYALVVNEGSNQLTVVSFGNSLSNTASAHHIALPGASRLINVSAIKDCNEWYALAISYNNSKVFKLGFGTNLSNSSPLITDLSANLPNAGNLLSVTLLQDRGKFLAFFSEDAGGRFWRMELGSSLSGNVVKAVGLSPNGSTGNLRNLSFLKLPDSQVMGTGINYNTGKVVRLKFPNACAASQPLSNVVSPSAIAYSLPGKYYVDLTVWDVNGNAKTFSDSILVITTKVDFFTTRQCVGDYTKFSIISDAPNDIVSWEWDFGDLDNPAAKSTEPSPIYQYNRIGTYQVSLKVVDKRGCSANITKTISISNNKPTPNFSFNSLVCPDNAIQLKDLSLPFAGETIQKWQWSFGDVSNPDAISFSQNPQYVYPEPGTYQVTLTVSGSSGCDASITKTVVINSKESYSLPDTVCVNERFSVSNSAASGASYEWDFCAGDLSQLPEVSELSTEGLPGYPGSMKNVAFNGNYYGFCYSYSTNALYRFDYGNDFSSNPTFTNLTSIQSALSGPAGVALVQETSGDWVGLVSNYNSGSLLRLHFGKSLTNAPTASAVSLPVSLSNPSNLTLVRDGTNLYALVVNEGSNQLTVVSFGNSLSNTASAHHIALPGASRLINVSAIKDCNEWYALAISYNNSKVFKLGFGTNLSNSSPLITDLSANLPNAGNLLSVTLLQDRGKFLAFFSEDAGGRFWRMELGSSLSGNVVKAVGLSPNGSTGNLRNLSFLKLPDSQVMGTGINYNTGKVVRLKFPNACAASQPLSNVVSPSAIAYSLPGKYYVDLTVWDVNGNAKTFSDSILVKNTVAPLAAFTTDKQCIGAATQFFGPKEGVSVWEWNFGDTNLAANDPANKAVDQNPTHQYTKEGTYQVTLIIKSANGCNNRITQAVTIYGNQKPQPAFSYPNQTCSFAELKFSDQSLPASGDVVRNWRWDFGDGQTSLSQNPIHIYNKGGNYQVTLSVSGLSGCDTSITQTVSILPGGNPIFSYSQVCIGDTVQFTNSSTEEATWAWDFGDPSSPVNTSNEKNPKHFYAAVGTYTVRLSIKTANGCIVSRQQEIKIRRLPSVDFITSKICANSPITFTVSALDADTTITDLAWNFGDPNSSENYSSDESPVHNFNKGGTYTINLLITTSAGCQGSISHTIEIPDPSTPMFTQGTGCSGQPIAFTDASTSALNDPINKWIWDFGDNTAIVNIRNPVHTFINPGIYTVKLTIEGSVSGCQNTVSKLVTVHSQPQASFSSTLDCQDYSIHFTDNSFVLNDHVTQWEWNFGGEGTSSERNPVYNFNRIGTFVVNLKVTTSNGCSAFVSQAVTLDPLPEADFRFSPDFQAPPMKVQFINDSRRAVRYEWDFGDGSPHSNELAPQHIYNDIGEYAVRLLAFDGTGCADTLIKTVNVAITVVDVKVKNVISNSINNTYTTYTEIINAGTVPVAALELLLQSGTSLEVLEKWTGILNPKQSFVYAFKAQLVQQAEKLPYLCVLARKPNNQEDTNSLDNRACTSASDEWTVLPAYPNPGTELTLPYILSESASLKILVFNAQGKEVHSSQVDQAPVGYNELKMDLSRLHAGLYLIKVIYQGQVKGQRWIKVN